MIMQYDKLERVTRKGRHEILFHGSHGEWQSSGTFAEIFEVSGHIVLISLLRKPIAVFHNLDEVDHFLNLLQNGTTPDPTKHMDSPETGTSPVRILSLFAGDFGD